MTHSQSVDRAEKAVLLGLFVWLASRFLPQLTSQPISLVYLLSEATVILMVVFRRSTHDISRRSIDWVAGFAGTFLPLMVVRSESAGVPYGSVLLIVGFVLSLGAQLSLRRSFGVVAANRGVRTAGVYGIVRHPMYLGYFVTHFGFLLMNPAPWNLMLYTGWTVCQLYRVHAEERVLSTDASYAAFARRVRYRLVPFVY
jgi:protein-S-isoprenylcysteine O-methyltransferase Ste14